MLIYFNWTINRWCIAWCCIVGVAFESDQWKHKNKKLVAPKKKIKCKQRQVWKLVSRRLWCNFYCHHLFDDKNCSFSSTRLHRIHPHQRLSRVAYTVEVVIDVGSSQRRWLEVINDFLSPFIDYIKIYRYATFESDGGRRRGGWEDVLAHLLHAKRVPRRIRPDGVSEAVKVISVCDLMCRCFCFRFDNHACTITVDSKEYSLTLWWESAHRPNQIWVSSSFL